MGKIRTVAQAQDVLDNEFAWRLKEIANVKSAIRTADATRERTLIRAGIPLLYAHWEGFVKVASETYLNYVANQGHKYRELKSCFIIRGLKGGLNELAESGNVRRNTYIVEFVMNEMDNRASIPYKGVIDASSNLSSAVFGNIASSIGISTNPYETKYHFIDESVLRRRNQIAHGEFLDVQPTDYNQISDEVVNLLRSYKTDIENALTLDSHRRSA
jgi:hypothetical protein